MFEPPRPLRPNPGGLVAIEDIVGRKREIARYWQVVERQSLILSAERRIGKTHIVKKMLSEAPETFPTIYQDLERVHTVLELVRVVYASIEPHLGAGKKLKGKAYDVWAALSLERLGDLTLPQAADHWKV